MTSVAPILALASACAFGPFTAIAQEAFSAEDAEALRSITEFSPPKEDTIRIQSAHPKTTKSVEEDAALEPENLFAITSVSIRISSWGPETLDGAPLRGSYVNTGLRHFGFAMTSQPWDLGDLAEIRIKTGVGASRFDDRSLGENLWLIPFRAGAEVNPRLPGNRYVRPRAGLFFLPTLAHESSNHTLLGLPLEANLGAALALDELFGSHAIAGLELEAGWMRTLGRIHAVSVTASGFFTGLRLEI